jgi:hypothetical protein
MFHHHLLLLLLVFAWCLCVPVQQQVTQSRAWSCLLLAPGRCKALLNVRPSVAASSCYNPQERARVIKHLLNGLWSALIGWPIRRLLLILLQSFEQCLGHTKACCTQWVGEYVSETRHL